MARYTPCLRISYQIAIVGIEQSVNKYSGYEVFQGLDYYIWIYFFSLLIFVSFIMALNTKQTNNFLIKFITSLIDNFETLFSGKIQFKY